MNKEIEKKNLELSEMLTNNQSSNQIRRRKIPWMYEKLDPWWNSVREISEYKFDL